MKKSVFILSLLLVAITSKSVSYKDVYNVASLIPYSSLKDGQRYYLIEEVSKAVGLITYWIAYTKGENDAPVLIGANPKLLTDFQVYVNRRVTGWSWSKYSSYRWINGFASPYYQAYPIFGKE